MGTSNTISASPEDGLLFLVEKDADHLPPDRVEDAVSIGADEHGSGTMGHELVRLWMSLDHPLAVQAPRQRVLRPVHDEVSGRIDGVVGAELHVGARHRKDLCFAGPATP